MTRYLVLFTFIVFNITAYGQSEDAEYYKKLNKAFEVYGAIFKELTENYVVGIDPEQLMEKGIEGMLDALDPYSVYISNENSEDVDLIVTGSYTGLGITVSKIDSMLTVTGITPGSSVREAGLRVGDRIYKIDTSIILHENNSKLREFTSAEPGKILDVYILRDGLNDTLNMKLNLDNITINSIAASKMLPGNIGYIKVTQFSRSTINDFKTALIDLKQKSDLSGLIIDVRDNPGGLLVSAVEVCEMFLPNDTEIVSTKGRNKRQKFTYSSVNAPLDTLIPLVILINEGSASASEILAGSLQDLDRAVIIGENSFGKGLVQSVTELPYDNSLKLTTAKYYMPSGRCIQLLDYPIAKDSRGLGLHHDSVFYTKNNRIVYESSGIKPDIYSPEDTLNEYQRDLLNSTMFFNYANIYASSRDSIDVDFEIDETILKSFRDFLNKNEFNNERRMISKLKSIENEAKEHNLSKNSLKHLNKALVSIIDDAEKEFEKNTNFIERHLKAEILRRFYSEDVITKIFLETDKSVIQAVELFENDKYSSILSNDKERN